MATGVLLAQPPNPPAVPPPNPETSLAAQVAELDKKEARLQIEERRLAIEQKERELAFQRRNMDTQFKRRMDGLDQGPRAMWKQRMHRFLPLLVLVKLMALCAVVCFVIHVLLTIIVFNDMRARRTMNGLWIVLVLISGVCGAVVYALFRMGERPKAD
jgi:hypothetical protein